MKQKNIDITPSLVSIKILWTNVLEKTHKPIVSTELSILNDGIKSEISKKIKA